MTNEEWLKSLSTEELADFIMLKLERDKCKFCNCYNKKLFCNFFCFKNITDWLKEHKK